MNVIFYPANLNRVTVQVLSGASHVGIDLIANLLGTQERSAIFGGKDRLNKKMSEGPAHDVQ